MEFIDPPEVVQAGNQGLHAEAECAFGSWSQHLRRQSSELRTLAQLGVADESHPTWPPKTVSIGLMTLCCRFSGTKRDKSMLRCKMIIQD